ncbi:MAG TPA: ABC transporter ATP-binding protein [Vulgatibacter sp.]|nr:ABC transporter ATP-binding protein [Vulgatibacter sp.]
MEIELRRVVKGFGRMRALDGIDCRIPAGRKVALIGPNGSGKSTLIRVIMGLLGCEGEVRLDGKAPFEDRIAVARRLAYVPQLPPQLAAPVGELVATVALTRGIDQGRIAAIARRLALDLDAVAARRFRDLSGGMKQKLLLALAFASDPSLLILDEPTASLDAHARDRFFQLVTELPEEVTVILCSHRLEEMRHLADHVLALDEGKIVYDGPAAAYLGGSAFSSLEVCVEDPALASRLAALGFRKGAGDWWLRTVARDEKIAALEAVNDRVGGGLVDVLVRDLESIVVLEAGKEDRQHG